VGFIGSFSALTLREQLLSILRSQIRIAFSYTDRATRCDCRGQVDVRDLASARRVYEGAVSLRRKIDLDGTDTDEIDRDLERLVYAILSASDPVRKTG
jgi:hypothetical protein